jgi:hypothetical protein
MNHLNKLAILCASMAFCSVIQTFPAQAASFFFSTGNADGRMATGARPAGFGKNEIEIGTDIVGGTPAPTFNAAFSLSGETTAVPEPMTVLGTLIGGAAIVGLKRKYKSIASIEIQE